MKPAIRTYQRKRDTAEPSPRRAVLSDKTNSPRPLSQFKPQAECRPTPHSFTLRFRRGAAEDQAFVSTEWLTTHAVDNRVPGEWKLERQMRFGAWCQIMGLACEWEGGYLFVRLTSEHWEDLRWASAQPVTEGEDELGEQLLRMSLAAPARRNRQRKWQDHHHRVSGFNPRASLALSRRSVFPTVVHREEEEEEDLFRLLPNDLVFCILDFLPVSLVLSGLASISKPWSQLAVRYANLHFASHAGLVWDSRAYFAAHPQARFLGQGAYKSVYALDAERAVSVMDMSQVSNSVAAKEVAISLLVTDLISEHGCPNFIQTQRVFQLDHGPSCWNAAGGGSDGQGQFQYIVMELCGNGDLEEHIKTFPGGLMPLDLARSAVFQMCFALFAAHRVAKMRHYDVKCLNFFGKPTREALRFQVHESGQVFDASAGGMLVKLADYGTADLDEANLDQPIELAHMTTLENTPIEFLLFPDATQTFACDVFQLGLSVVHVLTGAAPYEEILSEVKCPPALRDEIGKAWKSFAVLQGVLLEDADEDGVLFHTLYRYLVLFGFGDDKAAGGGGGRFHPSKSRVMAAVRSVLGTTAGASKKHRQARKQFEDDCAVYSLRTGTHHLIARARDRAKQLGMWDRLVWGLVCYCPQTRISAHDAVQIRDAFPTTSSALPPTFGSRLFTSL